MYPIDSTSERKLYNLKYRDEQWTPFVFHPDATSTTRWDDVARMVRSETGSVLDLGCGSGQMIVGLAETFPGFSKLVGIDISDARIDLANQVVRDRFPHLIDRVEFKVGRADERLPFADGQFDVVIATVVLDFVPDIFCAVDEMARVCRPGGFAVVTVANLCYVMHIMDILRGRIPVIGATSRDMSVWRQHGWDGGLQRYFTRDTVCELLRSAGFRPEHVSGAGKLAKMRRWSRYLCGSVTVKARRL